MSHKGVGICNKCGTKQNITEHQINRNKIRKCKYCGTYPSKEQISKAIGQIQNKRQLSIKRQVIKRLS